MSGGYSASPEDLARLSGQVKDVMGLLHGEVAKLETTKDNLAAGWDGAAAKAFADLLRRLNEIANNIHGDLGLIAEHLGETAKQYGMTEEDVHTYVSGITAALG